MELAITGKCLNLNFMSWFPCTSNINSEILSWQEINLYLQECLQPNDHICLLLREAQKRLCSLKTSLLSPLSFAEEAGITLELGIEFSLQANIFCCPKICVGCVELMLAPSSGFRVQAKFCPQLCLFTPRSSPGQGGYEGVPAQNLTSISFLKTFLKMHWGFLKSKRQLFLTRASQFRFDQNDNFFSQSEFCAGSGRGWESGKEIATYWISATGYCRESINHLGSSPGLWINAWSVNVKLMLNHSSTF